MNCKLRIKISRQSDQICIRANRDKSRYVKKIYDKIVKADNVAEAYLFAQDIIDKHLVVKDKPVHFVIRIEPIEE